MKLKLFKDFIMENSTSTYRKGCVMIYYNFPKIKELHNQIDEGDIYTEEGDKTFGLEDEPHVTLLYGLDKTVTLNQIKERVNKFSFTETKIYNASLFENDYDVLKFDVKGENLHRCNKELCKLPYKNDYPVYHPHMTIGYIKKGKGKKYVNKFKDIEYVIKPSYIVYSEANGTKTKIKLNK